MPVLKKILPAFFASVFLLFGAVSPAFAMNTNPEAVIPSSLLSGDAGNVVRVFYYIIGAMLLVYTVYTVATSFFAFIQQDEDPRIISTIRSKFFVLLVAAILYFGVGIVVTGLFGIKIL
ncbi:MAG: hypothetical protein KM296_00440 [Brockia lithotrophica]|nr:hypothetical protein [Brockia lithotrophica]